MLNKIKNAIIKGNNTKIHAIMDAPAPHIKFKIHVQNTIYIIFKTKMKNVLVTSQLYSPKQYVFTLP